MPAQGRTARGAATGVLVAVIDSSNDRSGDRTHDLKIKSLLLYQLSYPVGVGPLPGHSTPLHVRAR